MDAIPPDLSRAALSARDRLSAIARADASHGALGGMAQAARASIFADALLAAMHARLAELKSVAK